MMLAIAGIPSERKLKRPRSIIWQYYEEVTSNKAKCVLCGGQFQHSNNTSNLIKHLRYKHMGEYQIAELQSTKQRVPTGLRQCPPSEHVSTTKNLDRLLLNMIITDLQPPSIVEETGFRRFVSGLNSSYELPSKHDVMHKILPDVYYNARAKLKQTLDGTNHISLATETLTFGTQETYIFLYGHFLTPGWDMKSVLLEVIKLENGCTKFENELKRVVASWQIENKITSVMHDTLLTTDGVQTSWSNCSCFIRRLNELVEHSIDASPELTNIIKKVKEINTYFQMSAKSSPSEVKTKEVPEQFGHNADDSRWISNFHMLERMADQYDATAELLSLLGKNELCLSVDELSELEYAVKILRSFALASAEVLNTSSDLPFSTSTVIPMTRMLHETISRHSVPSNHGRKLYEELRLRLEQNFSDVEMNPYLAASTVMDPRFKKLPFSSPTSADEAEKHLIGEMAVDVQHQTQQFGGIKQENLTGENSSSGSLWNWFDEIAVQSEVQLTQALEPSEEMRRYLQERLVPRSDNPLQFWKLNSTKYPRLASLAKRYLCAPATSLPSKVLTFDRGNRFSARRDKFDSENLHMVLFLNVCKWQTL